MVSMSFGEGDLHARVIELEAEVAALRAFAADLLKELNHHEAFLLDYYNRKAGELGVPHEA